MVLAAIGMFAGLALLVAAAEWFVVGAVRVADRLRLSAVVIGAVVIGFGTSAPEMVVSGLAARQGTVDIAIGNIIGSNVANLSLVLGAAALVTAVTVAGSTIRREGTIAVVATIAFAVAVQNGLTRIEGGLLLLALALFVISSFRVSTPDPELTGEVEEFLTDAPIQLGREVTRTLVGLIGTLVAAQALVESATTIASNFGVGEGFIGLTIIAVGTSLPELATALQAARKDQTDLILGNLLGSNVFNSLGVSGIAGLVGAGQVVDPDLTGMAIALMLLITFGAAAAMFTGRRVVRQEGVLLLIAWVAMIPLIA